MAPPRVLKEDEVFHERCGRIFISPEAYEEHEPDTRGYCQNDETLTERCGLSLNPKGVWEFARTKDPTVRPRRTQAQAAFDRLVRVLPPMYQKGDSHNLNSDITKVIRALEKARDA